MGDTSLHGMGTSSVPASVLCVTHVFGLNCYPCVRTVPVTGLTGLSTELIAKRLGLIKEVIPRISRVAFMWNPQSRECVGLERVH